jgi:hypothetical protein
MLFDVLRHCLQLLGLSDHDIRQLGRNGELMHLQFRNHQLAWSFFRVPEPFNKPVFCATLPQIYEDAIPKVVSRVRKRGLVDPGDQGKGTELTPQQEAEIISRIECKSARN